MSRSTDALLFYGYWWDDEITELYPGDDNETEWEEVILAKRDIFDPWDDIPDEIHAIRDYAEHQRRIYEWLNEHHRKAKKAVAAEYGCDIDSHCSDDSPMPLIKITDLSWTAARGYPKQIDPAHLVTNPLWNAKLQKFATDLGIDLSEAKGPGWFLASWWG